MPGFNDATCECGKYHCSQCGAEGPGLLTYKEMCALQCPMCGATKGMEYRDVTVEPGTAVESSCDDCDGMKFACDVTISQAKKIHDLKAELAAERENRKEARKSAKDLAVELGKARAELRKYGIVVGEAGDDPFARIHKPPDCSCPELTEALAQSAALQAALDASDFDLQQCTKVCATLTEQNKDTEAKLETAEAKLAETEIRKYPGCYCKELIEECQKREAAEEKLELLRVNVKIVAGFLASFPNYKKEEYLGWALEAGEDLEKAICDSTLHDSEIVSPNGPADTLPDEK